MKKISLIKVTALVVTALLGSAFVSADESAKANIDTASTTLTKPEAVSIVETNVIPVAFDAFDKDKDGSISKREIQAGSDEKLKLIFDKLDTNKDQLLSKEEFKKAITRL